MKLFVCDFFKIKYLLDSTFNYVLKRWFRFMRDRNRRGRSGVTAWSSKRLKWVGSWMHPCD